MNGKKNPQALKIRPEENAVLLWNGNDAATAYISGAELEVLRNWAVNGTDTAFILRLKQLGLIDNSMQDEIIKAIARSAKVKAPLRSFSVPESLHIELTSACPLNCPQCYKKDRQNELPYQRYSEVLAEAEAMGVFQIALGGGEPLAYSYLTEAVTEAKGRGFVVSVTTSGAGLDKIMMEKLLWLGLDHLQVSLNGSTEAVHSLSRDGYQEAINALRLAASTKISLGINWVARKDNLDDFNALVTLAGSYNASNINVLRYKPCAGEVYEDNALTGSRLIKLAELIKSTKRISIKVDSAFSNLLCHLSSRAGNFSGCGAGRRFIALDSAGDFRPCSHIMLASDGGSLKDYWESSTDLAAFRQIEDSVGEDCRSCRYMSGCRGCRAIVTYLGRFEDGEKACIFAKLS